MGRFGGQGGAPIGLAAGDSKHSRRDLPFTCTTRTFSGVRVGIARYMVPMVPQKTYVETSWGDLWPLIA